MTSSADFPERYGPWALVTGASDGIGRAIARELAARGLHLVLVARRCEALEAVAQELGSGFGIQTRVVAADLSLPAERRRLESLVGGTPVGLVVAAAGFGTSGPFLEADPEAESGMLEVNCAAVLELCLHFAPRLQRRGGGGIILLSSLLAFQGVPGAAHYAATKAWVQTLAEGLRPEFRRHGIDLLCAAPGPVRSGFGARARMTLGFAAEADDVARDVVQALERRRFLVRPAMLSWLLEASLKPLPRFARTRILAKIMDGMTRRPPEAATVGPATRI